MQSIKSEGHMRQVTLGPVPEEEAVKAVVSAQDIDGMKLKQGVPDFVKESFYSFVAEYALIENSIIIHFFVPDRAKEHIKGDNNPSEQKWMDYWLKYFPAKLDVTARLYFDAEYPRLQAKYTPEVASWWFKAQGFANLIDFNKFVCEFLERLDVVLRSSS